MRSPVIHLLATLALTTSIAAYGKLSDASLTSIPEAGQDFDIKHGRILAPILVPRVPGTPGSQAVQRHFVDFFAQELPEWKVEFQNSSATTPKTGTDQIPFVNIIATRDPPWTTPGEVGHLALVAHYDSLWDTIDGHSEGFVGAVDSAAPCAMLLHAARNIDKALTKKWAAMAAQGHEPGLEPEQGVQLLLLDGEEAFLHWTDTDSLYGARALAEEWEESFHAAASTYKNKISNINLFVLLDLLGDKNPTIPSYYLTSHWAYQAMATLEVRLRTLRQFRSAKNHPSKGDQAKKQPDKPRPEHLFLPDMSRKTFPPPGIGDDHIPFLARGVEVLHLIPSPFPKHWHRITDDGEHLHMDTVEDWTKLVTAFAAEWMELEGYMGEGNQHHAPRAAEKSEL